MHTQVRAYNRWGNTQVSSGKAAVYTPPYRGVHSNQQSCCTDGHATNATNETCGADAHFNSHVAETVVGGVTESSSREMCRPAVSSLESNGRSPSFYGGCNGTWSSERYRHFVIYRCSSISSSER